MGTRQHLAPPRGTHLLPVSTQHKLERRRWFTRHIWAVAGTARIHLVTSGTVSRSMRRGSRTSPVKQLQTRRLLHFPRRPVHINRPWSVNPGMLSSRYSIPRKLGRRRSFIPATSEDQVPNLET